MSRLSFGLSPHWPTWTSSGDAVSIGAESNGTWRVLTVAAHGKGEPTTLIESAHRVYPNAWSHDGRYLLFQERRPESGWDLQVLDVAASGRPVGAPRAFANTPFDETSAAMSFDGRWIAYESNEVDGVVQVYVRSFPDGAHKVRASPHGGRSPAWDAHGNLYYWQTEDDTMWAVPTSEKGGRLLIGAPYAVWRGTIASAVLHRIVNPVAGARYDLERTGTRFLVLERAPAGAGPELSHPVVVLGGPIR